MNYNSKNYEDTMFDVQNHLNQLNLPVKYFQFDSWWYFKGIGDGVNVWDARPDIFPDGMKAVQQKLGLPVVLHNRYWSPDTSYQKNFSFIVEKDESLPTDVCDFFFQFAFQF